MKLVGLAPSLVEPSLVLQWALTYEPKAARLVLMKTRKAHPWLTYLQKLSWDLLLWLPSLSAC